MIRVWFALAAVALLGACGVDGPPERPPAQGVSMSGDVRVGVDLS